MSRFLLLLVLVGWLSWSVRLEPHTAVPLGPNALTNAAIFFAGFAVLILVLAKWSRRAAYRAEFINLNVGLHKFNRHTSLARMLIPAWFAVGVFRLGWGADVAAALHAVHIDPARFDTPGVLIACLPAFIAWMGLWWAQYPADMSLREQGLLHQLDAGLPIHAPPSLWTYLKVNLRLQLLFTIAPVIALLALRDVANIAMAPFGLNETDSLAIQIGVSLATAAVILLIGPELLRRVLHTEPLPTGALRQRLEEICRRHRIGYKNILLWRTEHNMGNAAVMGLIPQTRYILMSDLLLETMTDQQIEAVFAHEVGHVIHRHLLWFVVYFNAMVCAMVAVSAGIGQHWNPSDTVAAAISIATGAGAFILFLYLSRKFERQADVFAARTISDSIPEGERLAVAPHGASIFASALHQVARINCIPITAWSWCHGSIAGRVGYLEYLSQDPTRTHRFDRFMKRIYAILLASICGFGVWAIVTLASSPAK